MKVNGGSCGSLGTCTLTSGYTLTTTNYVVVTTTYDGVTETVFVNGVFDKSAAMTSSTPQNAANKISIGWINDDGASKTMDADVGVLMIYNRSLSVAEVADIYSVYSARFSRCQCAAGVTCSSTTTNVCDKCAIGYSGTGGNAPCTACSPGYSTSSIGSASCSQCAAGKFSSAAGSSCMGCGAAGYSSSGATSCTACPANSFPSISSTLCSCAPGYYSENGRPPCVLETTRLPSGRVFHVDAGQASSYPGSGSAWYDLSGRGNHMYWVPATISPAFGTFNGFRVLRTTPLTVPSTGYLRPVVSSTYNGIRVNSEPYSAVAVFKVNVLANNKVLLSFGPANNECSGRSIHPISTGFVYTY